MKLGRVDEESFTPCCWKRRYQLLRSVDSRFLEGVIGEPPLHFRRLVFSLFEQYLKEIGNSLRVIARPRDINHTF